MKVLLVNGSPHQKGSTYTSLMEVSRTLEEEGIATISLKMHKAAAQ